MSADLSTYTWQMPLKCLITGILLCSTTARIRRSPPRGITRSRQSLRCKSMPTRSWLVSVTSCTASWSMPSSARASWKMPARHFAEFSDSLPPRKITALPALKQRQAPSIVTFGRLSKIKNTEPIGTATRLILMPFLSSRLSSTLFSGSAKEAISSAPLAMASMRASFKVKRSIFESSSFPAAASRSCLFAARISGLRSRRIWATRFSTALRFSPGRVRSALLAFWAFLARRSEYSSKLEYFKLEQVISRFYPFLSIFLTVCLILQYRNLFFVTLEYNFKIQVCCYPRRWCVVARYRTWVF